jgi:formate dehydrogenase formation protein
MAAPGVDTTTSPWAPHRRRAELLRAHHSFAEDVLTLYLALLDVWVEAAQAAREQAPEARALAEWAGERVLPQVVEATVSAGPGPLADATRKRMEAGGAEQALVAWLTDAADDLEPVERYLARASLRGPIEVLEAGASACAQDPSPRGGRHCPSCGGLPQLSFRTDTGDQLVSGRRSLLCVRCGASWGYASNACASCGETGGSRRTIYAERREWPVVGHGHATAPAKRPGAPIPMFPHLRIEGCSGCNRYLIDVDLGHDARAVPEVDELAALPLDLYAAERGLSKITPNLMGF